MYLVTGASGKLGRAVISHLVETLKVPAGSIIAASRDPEKLRDLKGVEIRKADFEDSDGLVKSFAGAKRALIISTDSFAPGVRAHQHANAVAAATKAGIAHLVYTSMPNPATSAVLFAPDHAGTEMAIAESGIPGWTVLRHNWYFENLLMSWPQALKAGALYTAAGTGKIAHIARDDLALADAAALASDADGKTIMTLTGAEEFTTDELAAMVAKATSRKLDVVHVPAQGLVQGMVGAGLPEPMAQMFASFDVNTAQGGLSGVTGDFKKLTGVEPGKFSAWLASNASAFTA